MFLFSPATRLRTPTLRRLLSVSAPVDPAAYCVDLVRKHDYHSFLIGKFWTGRMQQAYFAIKAFSTELAMIQDSVSNPTIGAMRIQFWRDAVRDIYANKPPRHPIAIALHQAIEMAELPAYYLKRIVDARDAEMRSGSYHTADALVAHAESVSSSVLYLLLALRGLGASETLAHAASHLGTAQTISTLLRGLPHHAAHRQLPLPLDICARHGVKQEDVFRYGGDAAGIDGAVYDVAVLANDHILTCRDMFKDGGGRVPVAAMPVFLAAIPVASFLGRLEQANFDAFSKSLAARDWRVSWRIYRAAFTLSRTSICFAARRPQPRRPFPPSAASSRSSPTAAMAFFDSCPEELIHLVVFELEDPTAFSCTTKRIHRILTQPWVRASFFLVRHGKDQALYHALGRGRLLSPRVLDILLAGGAHFSRYLVQVAVHHYFSTSGASHFSSRAPWVKSVPLANMAYFLSVAAETFGDIPRGKNEDDGYIFQTFLREAKYAPENRSVSFEKMLECFETYKFMPLSIRDPLLSQLPLAIALEPRLLSPAQANGFSFSPTMRDFVFRKMFEKVAGTGVALDNRVEAICSNVRALCALDPSMFITRTVAAEVCLEAESNEAAYKALKRLDRSGDLPFALSNLVRDVIRMFAKARAITTNATSIILTKLYTEFLHPTKSSPAVPVDPRVRRTMLLTVFAAEPALLQNAMKERIQTLGLQPINLDDAKEVLLSAFVESHYPIFEYLRREGIPDPQARKHRIRRVSSGELRMLAEQVALHSITRENKGKTLKRLFEAYPALKDVVAEAVLTEHRIEMEGIVPGETSARLARSIYRNSVNEDADDGSDSDSEDGSDEEDDMDIDQEESYANERSDIESNDGDSEDDRDLGALGLDPLSVMLQRDESSTRRRGRRRWQYYRFISSSSSNNASRVPAEPQTVSKFIKAEYGHDHPVTAVFFIHAIVNDNYSAIDAFLTDTTTSPAVPITLLHFRIMAKLDVPSYSYSFYERIRTFKAPFYRTEQEYISPGAKQEVKAEPKQIKLESPPHGRKRARRSATSIHSYTLPDSDDEALFNSDDLNDEFYEYRLGLKRNKKTVKVVEPVKTDLHQWIEALGELEKEEQRKYKEMRKQRVEQERAAGNDRKIRVPKNDFYRQLTSNLRDLREAERLESRARVPEQAMDVVGSDADDEDYLQTRPPRKKRKATSLP
ncbi:hypothetical protein MKEN_00918200 [Mycena kentingensis (nom. inval.)]|nr:hypothetical protein MKEN_00918200 [Mycena kentingensis (nom. inval.)]